MKRPILTGVILIVIGLCCFGGGEGFGAVNLLGLVLLVAGIVVIVRGVKKKENPHEAVEILMTDEEINNSLMKQVETKQKEQAAAETAEDLAPEKLENHRRRYHYKDVRIDVSWKYGGRYGKTLADIGVKRGDNVSFVPAPNKDDPEAIAVKHKGTTIGTMKPNRMRNMVLSWQKADLPIFSVVNLVCDEYKLFLEVAFYGYPKEEAEES